MIFIQILLFSCKNNGISHTEIIQKERNNIISISNALTEIPTEISFGKCTLHIIDSVLIINEMYPKGEKEVHLFNKNTLRYLTSTAIVGRGPGEISSPGTPGIDTKSRAFWICDFGTRILNKFPIDSVLHDAMYVPATQIKQQNDLFLQYFGFLNDSIALGKAIHLTSNSSFDMAMVKFNIKTKKLEKYGYENPVAIDKKSNSYFEFSEKNNIYGNCYLTCDLLTVCNLDGTLKYNIYGPGWYDSEQDKNNYYYDIEFTEKNIIASYSGENRTIIEGNIKKGNYPSKLLVFDLDGNYLKTIDVGYKFSSFCIDEGNNRIIAYFIDKKEPLGYFEMPLF